ncbi:MAG: hydroxyacylglutathione hydrolase [Gammaproteobacteria bacterium]
MQGSPHKLETYMFPCLSDNYGFLLHDNEHDLTATVDTPDAAAIENALKEKNWTLTHILNTHHHWDHAGGNLELKEKTGCVIVGPRADASRIPGIDIQVGEGDEFEFGSHMAQIYDTPGHTRGHIVYYFAQDKLAFVGDTLFAMGCGRLFEGTPEQMWDSLQKIMRWPDDTEVYCAHEYTQANARFAMTVEPQNQDLINRSIDVDKKRAQELPTIPSTIGLEKKTNPFLRPMSIDLQNTINKQGDSLVDIFAKIRQLKDNF